MGHPQAPQKIVTLLPVYTSRRTRSIHWLMLMPLMAMNAREKVL